MVGPVALVTKTFKGLELAVDALLSGTLLFATLVARAGEEISHNGRQICPRPELPEWTKKLQEVGRTGAGRAVSGRPGTGKPRCIRGQGCPGPLSSPQAPQTPPCPAEPRPPGLRPLAGTCSGLVGGAFLLSSALCRAAFSTWMARSTAEASSSGSSTVHTGLRVADRGLSRLLPGPGERKQEDAPLDCVLGVQLEIS